MKRVLLITMPFCSIIRPATGISLLKARLHAENIFCDIKYFNIDFAKMIGVQIYEEICSFSPDQLIGERLFAEEYFSDKLPDKEQYKKYLKKEHSSAYEHDADLNEYFNQILSIKPFIDPFLNICLNSIPWRHYDIIGFTTTFQQNLASISLAHRVKRLHASKIIVFGGANCEGKMGLELHKRFRFIDFVCSGESDNIFPELVKKLSNQQTTTSLPGIIYRKDDESITTQTSSAIHNLDELPFPDYDDYFDQLQQASFSPAICHELLMETSRGCWWGSKSQCKFCGLNSNTIAFRSKNPHRVIQELSHLIERYAEKHTLRLVSMVDNILDMNYFAELLPEICKKQFPVEIFCEVKANLTKYQVELLRKAGITWIQPGIESLNSNILKLMAKGVSALQNIQLLKYCRQFDVFPQWNILTGFPGETVEDYQHMVKLISKITHLPPPDNHFPFALHRFSPYFVSPQKFGICNIRPENAYHFIYPFKEPVLFNLAYFFEFDYREDVKPPDYDDKLTEAIGYWQECYENNENLYSYGLSSSTLLIEDSRSNAVAFQTVLESIEKDIYVFCDKIRTLSSILDAIKKKYSNYPVRERDVRDILENMIDLNLMVGENNKYLSLAIPFHEQPSEIRKSISA